MKKPSVLILHAPGTNRDGDLEEAIARAGGEAAIRPLSELRRDAAELFSYQMLALPGGFSYGDALGAGRLFALDLETWLRQTLHDFIQSGRPVLGICNGFQALVKAGFLPGNAQQATLTGNIKGHFECRWVNLQTNPANPSPWLVGANRILCPVAHGEGRFVMAAGQTLPEDQVAFRYTQEDGQPAGGLYPYNPNGSLGDIAGITNQPGNVLGLMPHPENHIHPYQHPRWTHDEVGRMGLRLFKNGLSMV